MMTTVMQGRGGLAGWAFGHCPVGQLHFWSLIIEVCAWKWIGKSSFTNN